MPMPPAPGGFMPMHMMPPGPNGQPMPMPQMPMPMPGMPGMPMMRMPIPPSGPGGAMPPMPMPNMPIPNMPMPPMPMPPMPNMPMNGGALPPPPVMPSQTPAAPAPAVVPWFGPHETVYVHRLNEKIKIGELKKSLFHVFSQFGGIKEIYAEKRLACKGQAWIVFEAVDSAAKALSEMQGFNFYGNEMEVAYARLKADVVSKGDGSFVPRPKRKPEKKRKGGGKKGKDKKGKEGKVKKEKKLKKEEEDVKREAAPEVEREEEPAPARPEHEQHNAAMAEEDEEEEEETVVQGPPLPPPVVVAPVAQHPPTPAPVQREQEAPPNRILFVERLPVQCNGLMLDMLFQQYPGYKEARLVPGKPGIAFVEFGDHLQSTKAIQALQDFKITPTNRMKITFARQ